MHISVKRNLKSFPSHKAHRAEEITVSNPRPDTHRFTLSPHMRGLLHLHRAVCLFEPQLCAYPGMKGQAELAWVT